MQGTTPISLSAALLTPNQQITISDSPGINTLRLVGGLEIVGSYVSNTAVQLTLNNGALVTLLGAESFWQLKRTPTLVEFFLSQICL